MTVRKLYGASFGPYEYDDTDTIDDIDSEWTGLLEHASITDGGHLCGFIDFFDTNESNHLTVSWNEDDNANRTLALTVNGGNRAFALHGNLTVEAASLINQDVTTDAIPTFNGALLTGNLVTPKTAGKGLQVDTASPTFGWRDLKGKVTQRNVGVSKPTHAVYRGGLYQYQFAAGKEEYFTYHIDHDHVPDSDIFLHIHWSHIGALVNGGTITIEYEISYAKGFNQGAFGVPVSTTFIGTASVVQYQHIISEIQISAVSPDGNQLDSNDLEPDGIIEARVKITSNDITVSGGGVPDPFIHEADIHYQSTNIGTKQKAPDFYT